MMSQVQSSLDRLERWIRRQGVSGFDPYDVRAHPLVVRILKQRSRVIHKLVGEVLARYPHGTRRVLRISPTTSAETLALLAQGAVQLVQVCDEPSYPAMAHAWLDDVVSLSVLPREEGVGWGLPFDWQSRVFFPQGTIMSTTTVVCARAFLDLHLLTGDRQPLEIAEAAASTLADRLRVQDEGNGKLCFSYTPLDNYHVHNANLMVAELLARVDAVASQDRYGDLVNGAVRYTLSDQRDDGAFEYWGPPDRSSSQIDHYHTAFVLRSLFAISKASRGADIDVQSSLQRGIDFYLRHLFSRDGIPIDKPDDESSTNIRACAEAIPTLCELAELVPDSRIRLEHVVRWTIGMMQDETGYFYYMVKRGRTGDRVVRFPFMRWAQAPMYYALAVAVRRVDPSPEGADD
ncbi:hypothetical protein JW848_10295 [Candidatus Bipolaricaulota bacterium]|nr:hypothetical protein [Candidatus Bipolaricaulota bacterium]